MYAIGQSPLQSDFITYNDLIFKYFEGPVTEIPDKLPEVICRDNFENPHLEVVTHYGSLSQSAVGRIYIKANDGKVSSSDDFSVSRVFSPYDVKYQSSNLNLIVELQSPIAGTRRFKGTLGGSTPVVCVTGGLLDTSAWPLKQVTDFKISNAVINYAMSSVVVTQEDNVGSLAGRKLIQITTDNKYVDLTKEVLNSQYEVNSLTSSNAGTPLIMASGVNRSTSWGQQYFFIDLNRLSTIFFGNALEFIRSKPVPLANGEMVFSLVDSSSNGIVRKMNIQTKELTDIYKAYSLRLSVLPGTNKIVTASNSTNRSILIHDLVDGTQLKIDPPISTNCYPSDTSEYGIYPLFGEHSVFLHMSNSNYVILRYNCGSDGSRLYGVSLDQLNHIDFGTNACILDYSDDYSWIEIGYEVKVNKSFGQSYQSCQPNNVIHYNLKTGISYSITNNPLFGSERFVNASNAQAIHMITNSDIITNTYYYSITNKSLLKLNDDISLGMIYTTQKPQLIKFNQSTNQTQEICTSAVGDKISIGSMEKNLAYLLTHDLESNVYYAYKITSEDCLLVNSFPSAKKVALEVALSDVGMGLILGDENTDLPTAVYYMPLSGKPTYQLNLFEQDIYKALEFKINSKTRELFLKGSTKDSTTPILYKFLLPDFAN